MDKIRAIFDVADRYEITVSIVGQTGGYVILMDTIGSHASITIECGEIYAFVIKTTIIDDVIRFGHAYQEILAIYDC